MRRLLGPLVALSLLLSALPAQALNYYQPGPSGPLGLAQPTFGQALVLEPDEVIVDAKAWIDGEPVPARWTDEGQVQFQPARPLPPGEHTARLQVFVAISDTGSYYRPLDQQWSFTVAADAVTSLPTVDPEGERARAAVNRIRQQLGLSLVTTNESLTAAAQGHAAYLAANPAQYETNGHGEDSGTPGFTGATPGARSRYWGWTGGTSEVIAVDRRAEDAIEAWMATLYHRIPLVAPETSSVGYSWAGSEADGFNLLVLGQTGTESRVIAYPYDRMTAVPAEWDGREWPDPLALYGVTGPVGYPITLTWGGPIDGLALTAASLTGPAGEVPLLRYDPTNDERLSDTVAVIPRAPLQSSTTYTAHLSGWIDRGEGPVAYDERWSFTTAAWAAPFPDRWSRVGRQVKVTGRSFAPGIQVFVDGMAMQVERRSATELAFTLPAGSSERLGDLLLVNPDGREAFWPEEGASATGLGYLQYRSLQADGKALTDGALVDPSGRLFVPEAALRALGGTVSRIEGLDRADWTWPGRSGEYTKGSLKATVDGVPYTLKSPPFRLDGKLWLEAEFAAALSGAKLSQSGEAVVLGRPVPPPAVTGEFTDIKSHWAATQIRALAQQGVISGYPDGTFRPDTGLSRAAFIKLLVQAMGLKLEPRATGPFGDAVGHWVSDLGYLGAARAAGILPDWRDGRLEPDQLITRTEIAVMLTRALRLETSAQQRAARWSGESPWLLDGRPFLDAADWSYRGHVAVAIESGLINGYAAPGGGYLFSPQREATRAEAAVMVSRFMAK